MADLYRAFICGLLCFMCISAVRADVDDFSFRRSLFQPKSPQVKGTTSSCTISGSTYQSQCASFYRNIASGFQNDATSAARAALAVLPAGDNPSTGVYAAGGGLGNLAKAITGQTTLGADGTATILYGASAGLDNLVNVVVPTGANPTTGIFKADSGLGNLAKAITGQTTLGADGTATSLYGANAGIGNLVTRIFDHYPAGAAGTADTEAITASAGIAVYTVSAGCGAGVVLGGTVEVTCDTDPVGGLTADQKKVVASYIGSFISTTVKTGSSGEVGGTFIVSTNGATSPYHTQELCGQDGNGNNDNSKACACTVTATPLCEA